MRWEYGDIIKVAGINVRGMRDPAKREDHHTNEDKWS